jgi:hypothetical protein
MISTELFPYASMPIRLEHGDKKDKTICYFSCPEHLDKYLTRYKLNKPKIKVDYRDGEPTKSSQKHKKSLEQRTPKSSSGSASGNKRSTKNVDAPGNTNRTRKPKSK